MNCKAVKEKLLEYHKGKLNIEDYKAMNDHLLHCDKCAMKLDLIISSTSSKKSSLAKPFLQKKASYFVFFTLIFLVIFTATISYCFDGKIYQLFGSKAKVGFGEAVHISTEDSDIKLTVTHVAASHEQTILYFQIKDVNAKNHFFTDHEDMKIVEKDIWKDEAYHPVRALIVEEKEKGVTKGELYLPPIKEENETITVKASDFFQLKNEEIELYSNEWFISDNRSIVKGDWQIEIPVKKYEEKIFELNETIDILGTEVEISKLTLNPTSTILTMKYKRDNSNENNKNIQISHLETNGQNYEVNGSSWGEPDEDGKVEHTFYMKGMYFYQPDTVEIFFSNLIEQVGNQVKIDFEITDLPHTFDYLGEPITIKSVKEGNPTKIVIKEQIHKERAYNELNLNLSYYRFHENHLYDYDSTIEKVWIDREGRVYQKRSDASLPQQLLSFSSEQIIEVYPMEKGAPSFRPKFLFIEGYTRETDLEEYMILNLPEEKW